MAKEQEITVYEVCAAVSYQCDVSTGGIQVPSSIQSNIAMVPIILRDFP